MARGGLRGRTSRWALLLGGATATAALDAVGGVSGLHGGRSGRPDVQSGPAEPGRRHLRPAQCGAALLLLGPLRRVLRRPTAWAVVAVVNLSAMTVFLWHQTAMIVVTTTALLLADGPLPGLHTVPDGAGWVVARLLWLPVFALALLGCWAVFRSYEQGGRRGGGSLVVGESAPERKGRARRA